MQPTQPSKYLPKMRVELPSTLEDYRAGWKGLAENRMEGCRGPHPQGLCLETSTSEHHFQFFCKTKVTF